MSNSDFDSAIPRFDPWRPSQQNPVFVGFQACGQSGHTGTDGTPWQAKSRHNRLAGSSPAGIGGA